MTPKFKLICDVVYRAQGSTNHESSTVASVTDHCVAPQSQKTIDCALQIPMNLFLSIQNCDIITVEYRLKVHDGCLDSQIRCLFASRRKHLCGPFYFSFRPTWISALLLIQKSSSPCSYVHIVWSMAAPPGHIQPVPSGDRPTVIFLLLQQWLVPIPMELQEGHRWPALPLHSRLWVLTLTQQHHCLRKGVAHTHSCLHHMGVNSLHPLFSTLLLLQRSHHWMHIPPLHPIV